MYREELVVGEAAVTVGVEGVEEAAHVLLVNVVGDLDLLEGCALGVVFPYLVVES